MTLDELPMWYLRTFVILFGLLFGSFLNVVIYRVPRDMSVVRPASRCGGCGKPIAPYDNIPVLSWLILRGRARCCGSKISPRYPLVELIGGGLSLAVFQTVLRDLPESASLLHATALYLVELALALGLVAAAFIDAEHMYLPDPITFGGALLGLVTVPLRGATWQEAFVGAAVGFAGVWLPFGIVYKRLRGREGIGMGDAKLTMLAGAWFGWQGAAFVLLAGAAQGSLIAIVVYLVHGKIDEPEAVRADREELQTAAAAGDEEAAQLLAEDPLGEAQGEGFSQARIPFGPFLVLACLEYLLWGPWITRVYEGFLGGY